MQACFHPGSGPVSILDAEEIYGSLEPAILTVIP
jgi:hypothetical protein